MSFFFSISSVMADSETRLSRALNALPEAASSGNFTVTGIEPRIWHADWGWVEPPQVI